jgi:hypothetical protein
VRFTSAPRSFCSSKSSSWSEKSSDILLKIRDLGVAIRPHRRAQMVANTPDGLLAVKFIGTRLQLGEAGLRNLPFLSKRT